MSGETTGRPRVSDERLAEKIKRGTALAAVYESLAGRDSEQAFALAVMLDLRDARDLLRRAREALTKLRRSHMTCEDCWYSCPKSGECCNDGAGDKCDCGADEDNAIIDGLLAALDEETK